MIPMSEDLVRYLAARDRQHAEEIGRAFEALTDRERRLVREAAVMGYVRGAMSVPGWATREQKIPHDQAIVAEVVGCCLAQSDLYPLISGRQPDTHTPRTQAQ